jgi:hypothetical protein
MTSLIETPNAAENGTVQSTVPFHDQAVSLGVDAHES